MINCQIHDYLLLNCKNGDSHYYTIGKNNNCSIVLNIIWLQVKKLPVRTILSLCAVSRTKMWGNTCEESHHKYNISYL
jgi:hypothetical protein